MWAMGIKVVASLAALSTLAVASPQAVAQAAGGGARSPRRVLVYGDDNTWGIVATPRLAPATRYPPDVRWSGRLAGLLGSDYEVIEDGLPCRTTDLNSEWDGSAALAPATFNGAEHLPAAVAANMPLDLVVIMLGTHDLLARHDRDPETVAQAAADLGRRVRGFAEGLGAAYPAPAVLIVTPVKIARSTDPEMAELYAGAPEKSQALAEAFRPAVAAAGLPLFDAGAAIGGAAHGVDGVHLSPEDHADLAGAIAPVIRDLIEKT